MNHKGIFDLIMSQEPTMDPIEVDVEGVKYQISTSSELLVYASNIVLVLEGRRLAFRSTICDEKISKKLSQLIIDHTPNLMLIPYPEEEPSFILKSNYEKVMMILSNSVNRGHIAMGQLLGYAYTGADWINGYRDTYIIGYQITDNNSHAGSLYNFNVPINKYNNFITQVIIDDLIKYQDILGRYDVNVEIQCMMYPKNGMPSLIDLP